MTLMVSPNLIPLLGEAPKLGGRCASEEAAPSWPVLLVGNCLDEEEGPDEGGGLVPNSIRDFFGGGGSGRRTLSSKAGASTVPPRGNSRSGGDCLLFHRWNLDWGTSTEVGGGE